MGNIKANKINCMRKLKCLNQQELAESIGVSTGTISNYENQLTQPSLHIAKKICEVLNCSFNDIFFGKEL